MENDPHLLLAARFLEREFLIPPYGESSREQLLSLLRERVSQLLDQDVDRLILLLYQLDIAENKVRQILSPESEDPALELALLILQRQMEKIKSREQYPRDPKIAEEDRW
ncbi:MAG: hypothetical protein ACYCOO_05805 [Chitinophagaceae bacterium]